MDSGKLRPLLELSYAKPASLMVKLPYSYSAADIQALGSYLAPCLRLVGVDYENSQDVVKGKYRLCGHLGKNISDGQPFNFTDISDMNSFSLQMDIAMPLSSDPMQGDIITQVSNMVKSNLHLYRENPKTHQTTPFLENQEIDISDSHQNTLKAALKFSNYQNCANKTVKTFINCITIPVILPKTTKITLSLLKEIIRQDLSQTISIMAHNQMYRRVVQYHYKVIPIQNYFSLRESEDREFTYFISEGPPMQSKNNFENSQEINPPIFNSANMKAKNQLAPLILLLVLVAIVYGYLKIKQII